MLERMWRKGDPLVLLVGMQIDMATMDINLKISLKTRNKTTIMCLVAQSCLTLCNAMDYGPPASSVHRDSPHKNTEVGCHALLQGIFPTQWINPGLPHCRWIFFFFFFTIWANKWPSNPTTGHILWGHHNWKRYMSPKVHHSSVQFSSVHFSPSVVSDSLRPHE